MAKLDVQYLIDVPRSVRNGGASIISTGGGSSALPDFTLYVKRDGSTPMLGNFDVGGFSVTNVSLIDGIDLPAHVANPNAHHNQTHGIIGSDHTISASPLQLVGAVSLNTLGIISPLSDATLSVKEAILKTDASGFLKIVKLTTTDSVRTPIIDTATGHLTLSPASDLLLNPGSKLTKIYATHAIQTNGFTSGWTGYGFRLDQDISRSNKSHFEVDDIVVRGSMSVYELLIRQIRATNGSFFVTSSAKIKNVAPISGGYRVSTVASGETSTTDLSHGFLAGDLIRSQRTKWNGSVLAGIYQSDLQVTTVINLYEFDAALVSGDAPSIGMEYVRLGNASNADRRGSIYLTADDTNAPFIDVVDGISSHSLWNSSGAVKVRIGKLTGITGQADAYGIFSGNSAATWQSMETLNGFRIGYSGTTRFKIDTLGNLNIFNSSGSPVITLENSGLSYFSGVMTIGENGEIRQGTGTFESNWTGLRIWNDAGKGRIGGYKSNVLQWYADTNGELRSGGGVVGLSADGLVLTRYITEGIGTPVAGTESTAAISWWDDINNRTGQTPISRIYAARDAIGVGGVPSLVFEVDQSNSNINKRPAIWLSSSGASLAPELWFVNVYSIIGIPGIFPQRTFGTTNTRVDFSGGLYFGSHILRLPATSDIDIGTVGNPFRTIYAQNIVATSTTGAAISGSIWQNDAADMYIRSNSASNRTLYIANPGTGSMNLDVEMNITLGGTVDGVDISGFYTAYQAHTHSHSSLSGITADQHHAQTHVLATNTGLGPYQTMSGAASGQVLRASSATTANFQALSHADLTGITADQHHAQVHGILSSDHTVIGSALQVIGLTATNTLGLLTPSSNPGQAAAILRTDALGNITIQILGLVKGDFHSPSSYRFLNEAGTGYRNITADGLTGNYVNNTNGYWYTSAEWHSFRDTSTAAFKPVALNKLLVSNDSAHVSRVPANGIYSLGAIRGDTSVITPLLGTLSGSMTLQPAVDLLLDPASNLVKIQSGVSLQAHNYASQTTGWRITNDGQADFRHLFTDEMHAKSFIADLEQALAGGQIISKSVAILAVQNFVAPAAGGWTYIYVEDLPSAPDMAVFESGDTIGIRKFSRANGSLTISWCWGVVTSYVDGNGSNFSTGTQQWLFTRSASPNAGAMAIGASVEVGAIVLDYGQSGNGIYEVNAIDGLRAINSPYLRFSRWTSHPASGMVERVRLGNLKGIWGQDEYGLFAGTGTANTDRWLRLSDYAAGNGINNLPFRLRNNGVTTVEFNAWNDVWMGPSSADKRFIWDGSQVTVKGAIVITAASSGYANMTDRPTSLAGINSAEGAKLGGIEAGATVGAAWGVNLNLIPPRFAEAPTNGIVGLHLTPERLGYWNGSAWKMWMNNAGQFFFGGDTGARLQWDGTALAGYSANAVQWAASAVTGQLTAGGEAVVLDVNGETIYRPTIVVTAEIPEPGFGTMPDLSPTAAQALEFRDTAATFYRPGAPYSYDYPGNTLLRIYSSSKHHVPNNLTPAWWTHRIDAVIEVPAITEAGDSAIYTRWLWLKAPTVVVDGVLKVGGNTVWHAGNFNPASYAPLSGATFSGVVSASAIGVTGGGIYSDSSFQFFNNAGSLRQAVTVGYFQIFGNAGAADTGNISVSSNASGYGYFNYNYNNLRSGYLLWDAAKFQMVADGGRIISLLGAGVSINEITVTSGYVLDVNGATRFRGSIAANAHINLSPIAEPATSAATGILWMGTDNKLYFKKPNGTKIVVVN